MLAEARLQVDNAKVRKARKQEQFGALWCLFVDWSAEDHWEVSELRVGTAARAGNSLQNKTTWCDHSTTDSGWQKAGASTPQLTRLRSESVNGDFHKYELHLVPKSQSTRDWQQSFRLSADDALCESPQVSLGKTKTVAAEVQGTPKLVPSRTVPG
ncbi:hypothetical protein LZ30DRAFT_771785 [Colletotrichum cereale]|nr:hypothetical protein LZ30DRAFT_771785 [Colletotrichum cereale]